MRAIHAGHGTHTIAIKFVSLTSDLLSIWPSHKKHYSLFYFTKLFSSYHFSHDLASTTYLGVTIEKKHSRPHRENQLT